MRLHRPPTCCLQSARHYFTHPLKQFVSERVIFFAIFKQYCATGVVGFVARAVKRQVYREEADYLPIGAQNAIAIEPGC